MGKTRAFSRHVFWSELECDLIKIHYPTARHEELLALFQNRSLSQIQNKANWLGVARFKSPKMSHAEMLKSKRESMARRRAANLPKANKYSREYHHKTRDVKLPKQREYYLKHFFIARARRLRGNAKENAIELARIWKIQKGLCALTGRKLDRTAQLDHIHSKARGGGHDIKNVRWLCKEANLARRELSDQEFISICSDVIAWIGKRIEMVEAI